MDEINDSYPAISDVPDYLRIVKTIRIAVSDDVFLTQLEKEIIDTPDFQRLRGVRQLGSVYLVFPTALHTRFDHCLGTLAMADRMIRHIKDNTHSTREEKAIAGYQEALIRLYALLHDLPHIPFGHTLEDELCIFERHDKNEKRFERFFGPNSAVGSLIRSHLGEEVYHRFRAIYQWNGKLENYIDQDDDEEIKKKKEEIVKSIRDNDDAFIYDLVSNTVCADLLDYLRRDSYFCNLLLGLDYRFLNFLYLRKDGDVRRVFIRLWKQGHHEPRRDTLTDLVRLLEARYIVAERAYFHHAKIISGAMLGRAIQEATSNGGEGLTEEQIYGLSDDTLLYELRRSKQSIAARLADYVHKRQLYKTVLRLRRDKFEGIQVQEHDEDVIAYAQSLVDTAELRKDLEDQLAIEIDAEPGDVLVYAPDEGMNLKVAEMKVLWRGKATPFKDIDDSVVMPKLNAILDSHRKLWAIHVMAKPDLTDDQREQLIQSCQVKFLSAPSHRAIEEQKFNETLVERCVRKMNLSIPPDLAEFQRLRQEAAAELANSVDQTLPFKQRLCNIVSRYFGGVSVEPETPGLLELIDKAEEQQPTNGDSLEHEFVGLFRQYFGPKYPSGVDSELQGWYRQKLSSLPKEDVSDYLFVIETTLKETPRNAFKLPQRSWNKGIEPILAILEEELTKFLDKE